MFALPPERDRGRRSQAPSSAELERRSNANGPVDFVNYGNFFELVTKWPRLMGTKEIQKSQVVLEYKFEYLAFWMKKTPNNYLGRNRKQRNSWARPRARRLPGALLLLLWKRLSQTRLNFSSREEAFSCSLRGISSDLVTYSLKENNT